MPHRFWRLAKRACAAPLPLLNIVANRSAVYSTYYCFVDHKVYHAIYFLSLMLYPHLAVLRRTLLVSHNGRGRSRVDALLIQGYTIALTFVTHLSSRALSTPSAEQRHVFLEGIRHRGSS